jgi:hypothetical protein
MPPARIPGRLTSRRLISSTRGAIFGQGDPHRGAVWLVGHIPPGKLRVCFDNLSMHSCVPDRMSELPHVPLRADASSAAAVTYGEATIRTRGETRMTGMKHSRPRTDLVALSRGAPGEELSVPLASLSLSSAPRRRCSSRARVPPARLGHVGALRTGEAAPTANRHSARWSWAAADTRPIRGSR